MITDSSADIKSIYDAIQDGSIRKVAALRDSEILDSLLQKMGSEFIYSVSSLWDKETVSDLPTKTPVYVELLKIIALKLDPEYAFVAFLEQLDEETCGTEKFMIFIPAIQISLHRLSKSRGNWLEWTLSTFKCYLDSLPPIKDFQIQDNEKKMLVDVTSVGTLVKLIHCLTSFLQSFIDNWSSVKEFEALTLFGFQLLGAPAMYIYTEKFDSILQINQDIVAFIDHLKFPVYKFLDDLDDARLSNLVKSDSILNVSEEILEDQPSIFRRLGSISLAIYYYVSITTSPFTNFFPLVFDKFYLLHKLQFLSLALLRHEHNAITRKGLILGTILFNSVENGCIPYQFLDYSVHQEFIKVLSSISIHSHIFENRKSAIELLKCYIWKFDSRGTSVLFLNMFSVINNSDVESEIITAFRNKMFTSFMKSELLCYQKGKLLIDLLKIFCSLQDDTTASLMRNKNKIITTLHLIALILRRDNNNQTTIADHFLYFKTNYLDRLQSSIDRSREEVLKDIHLLEKSDANVVEKQFNVVVGEESLPLLRNAEKLDGLRNALTLFLMIEHALTLVLEYAK